MNIAIFCPNWIGDVVMATPALTAIRSHFADAKLIGVLKSYVAGVLDGGNWFDETVFVGGKQWSQSIPAVAWQLRRIGIDMAVLFTNSFRTAMIARLAGCRRII